MTRGLFLALGTLSLVVGVIFLFVPILPTVPFLLLAAYCFSKSSQRLSRWISTLPYIGPMIRADSSPELTRRQIRMAAVAMIVALAVGVVVTWLLKRSM